MTTTHAEPRLAPIVAMAVHRVLNTQFHLTAEALTEPPAAPAGYASKLQSRIDLSGARVHGEIVLSLPDALANLPFTVGASLLGGASGVAARWRDAFR